MAKLNILELRQSRELWMPVNIDALSQDVRSQYLKRKNAVDLYIDGNPLKQISEETGVLSCEIIRLVRKCIALNEKQIPIGYEALIPRKHTVKTISKLQKLFLQYPSLEAYVIGNYFNDKKYTLERNMNVRTLHTKFLDECRHLGIQDYEYPFTLKDNGYDALNDYINAVESKKQFHSIEREGKDARQKFESTGYGEANNLIALNPYGIVQIDGHKIDMLYSVEVENEQGEVVYMPATRAWLIAVIDVATRAIIGYSVSPYENYNQSDVLMAIHNSIVPHEKIEFTHRSFKYPPNGGYPSLAIPESKWATFDMIMLDNAKSHLATNTVDKLLNNVRCAVNFGSVATPETRGIVERFFKTLETGGFHRLPSTTGSNIRDNKRNDPEKNSVKYHITYSDICELLEYLIAEYNNSAHSSLENQTPLQVMERRVQQAGMYPYVIPVELRKNIEKLTYFTEERTVRGGYSTGTQPHISYLGTKYHAYDRKIPMDMINKKAFIEVNPADVSHVELYDTNGVFVANLVAMGEWGRRPHSLRTHKAALARKNKNKDRNSVFSPNLSLYEDELRKNAKKSRRERTKATIAESEMGRPYKNPMPTEPVKYKAPKKPNDATTYSKEEMDLINSISIEEAYKRGLI
mgnify:FL=1